MVGKRVMISKKSLLLILAICLLFLSLALCLTPSEAPVTDDAFITFRYVENLVNGNGLVFSKGERVEAISNFLWTMLLVPAAKLGLFLPPVSVVMGLTFGLLTIMLAWLFPVLYLGANGYLQFVAPLLLATQTFFVDWSARGLETSFYAFLITAGTLSLALEDRKGKALPLSGVLFALAAMTRPEAPILFLGLMLIMSLRALAGRRISVQIPLNCMIFCLIYGAFIGFRIYYYQDILPNSVYVKVGGIAAYEENARAVFDLVMGMKGYIIFFPALCAFLGKQTGRSFLYAGASAASLYMVTLLFVGELDRIQRYVVPVLPLLFMLVQQGIFEMHWLLRCCGQDRLGYRYRQGLIALLTATIIFVNFLWNNSPHWWEGYRGEVNAMGVRLMRCVSDPGLLADKWAAWSDWDEVPQNPHALFGDWIRENVREDSVIVYDQMGQTPFYAGLNYTFVDSYGLTDRTIARLKYAHATGKAILFRTRSWLLDILPVTSEKASPEAVSFAEYFFARDPDYVFVRVRSWQLRNFLSTDAFNQVYEKFFPDTVRTRILRHAYRKKVMSPAAPKIENPDLLPSTSGKTVHDPGLTAKIADLEPFVASAIYFAVSGPLSSRRQQIALVREIGLVTLSSIGGSP